MNFFDSRSAERFAELLDETSGTGRHHSRGQADDQFADLVAIGHSLSAARSSGVQVDSEFRVGLRAMLVATAERDGIGATAARAEPDDVVHTGVRETGRGILSSATGRRIRVRGAIVLSVAAGAMAVSGISAASENASPGDALYGVKRSTERAQLAMAGSDVTRGQLSLDFARTRLTEATAMDGGDASFATVLNDMDNDTRQGVKLLTGSAVTRKDLAALTTVDSFVAGQRSTFQPILTRLSAANLGRAMTSLGLLDDVRRRAVELRTGLACGTVTSAGSDELGPELAGCATAGKDSTTPERPQGTGERQGSKSGGTAVNTGKVAHPERTVTATATPAAARPGAKTQTVPNAETESAPADVEPTDAPDPDLDSTPAPPRGRGKGSLGNILGGVLGG